MRKYLPICLLCLLGACIDRVDLDTELISGQLVVDGSLTNERGDQILRLGETAPTSRIPIPIEDANITLIDDQGLTAAYYPDRRNPGDYILGGNNIKLEIGRTYFIEIELSNGKTYRSKPEKMQENLANMDSTYFDFSREKEVNSSNIIFENTFIHAYIDVNMAPTQGQGYFKWEVEEVYRITPTIFPDPFGRIPPPCYVYVYTSDINLNLHDASQNDVDFLQKMKVGSQKITFAFREKHYFSIKQKSLNRTAFEYWEHASRLLENSGSVFDTPPGPLKGNIYNVNDETEEVLGYFDVSSVKIIRFRTFKEDIPVDQIPECDYNQFKRFSDYPDHCVNCLSVRNSTLERPDFF